MSQQVLRQVSVRSTVSMTSDYVDSDEDMDAYYNDCDDIEIDDDVTGSPGDSNRTMTSRDPEHFEYHLLDKSDAKKLFQDSTEVVRKECDVTRAHAHMMLQRDHWDVTSVVRHLKRNNCHLAGENNNESEGGRCLKRRRTMDAGRSVEMGQSGDCGVCFVGAESLQSLDCQHGFCRDCWAHHIHTQVEDGVFSAIRCMEPECVTPVPEDFALSLIQDDKVKAKYEEFVLRDQVVSHAQLRFCPGHDCTRIVQATETLARRVICDRCQTHFCFACNQDYHAPLACADMKKWSQKCEDDSETANYIAANTKDCPKCHVCIEKNGGCNHMQCQKCHHDFCWVCLQDWKSHDSYYECSRFKEKKGDESDDSNSARKALEKYLFYYQRWENHTKSLKLEEETRDRIQDHIEKKVMQSEGTWIDWQYLLDACTLLHRCRYTLKFTYPYAYLLEAGPSKDCFEHIQAQLELEIERLSWKVERAQITDRGDLERQMDTAEKRRLTLLQDYLGN